MIVGDEAPGLAWVTLHYDMDIILHLCLTLTSNWELNVFKIQIVMMREHGSEARGGRGRGRQVKGWRGDILWVWTVSECLVRIFPQLIYLIKTYLLW